MVSFNEVSDLRIFNIHFLILYHKFALMSVYCLEIRVPVGRVFTLTNSLSISVTVPVVKVFTLIHFLFL